MKFYEFKKNMFAHVFISQGGKHDMRLIFFCLVRLIGFEIRIWVDKLKGQYSQFLHLHFLISVSSLMSS
jgi:hypothetical protein